MIQEYSIIYIRSSTYPIDVPLHYIVQEDDKSTLTFTRIWYSYAVSQDKFGNWIQSDKFIAFYFN